MSNYQFRLENVDGEVRVCGYREDDGHFVSDKPSDKAQPLIEGLAEIVRRSGISGMKVTVEETK